MSAEVRCPHCGGGVRLDRNFVRRVVELEGREVERARAELGQVGGASSTGPPPIPGLVVVHRDGETLVTIGT